MSRLPPRARIRLRLAIGADRITAVLPGLGTPISVPCTVTADPLGLPALSACLEELRLQLSAATSLQLARATVDVALLPPLAEARLVSLPPLRKAEAEKVLFRDAARFFVGSSAVRALSVRLPDRGSGQPTPVLAVSAPAALIEQICAALARLGWRVRNVVPALAGWLDAAARSAGKEPHIIVAQVADTLHVMRVQKSVQLLRRAPISALPDLVEAMGAGPGRAFVWASDSERAAIERVLTGAQWQIERLVDVGSEAVSVAAHFAGPSDLELVPQSLQLERQARQRRRARQLMVTAIVLLLGSAFAELWGTRRELRAVRAQRAAIRQEVAPLLAARDSINTLIQRRAHIDLLQSSAPLWTSALFDLAMLLPGDTHLRSLRATGDTLVIEATSARAGDAMQALRNATTLRDVRLKGQVERELEDGATALERFSIQARLVARDSMGSAPDSVPRPPGGRP